MAARATDNGINATSEQVFEKVFKARFKNLYAYACTIIKEENLAKEVVQQAFVNTWKQKDRLLTEEALIRYLYTAVYHTAINQLKHGKVRRAYQEYQQHFAESVTPAAEKPQQKELQQRIQQVFEALPEKCGLVFHMNRYEGLKYAEIARKLNISEKAVEKHITHALKVFRVKLKGYMTLIILLCTTW